MSTILHVSHISKQYRLGLVGSRTLKDDLTRWWYKVRGKEDPFLTIGAVNNRSAQAQEDYVWALRDINFEVAEGEVLGIIGKNGAGKSTLLKILSRVTSPTTGVIKTRGRIASLLEVGTGFHPELTGRENIYLNGTILGMTKAEIKSKEEEIVAFSGCEMYIDTPVKRYSSGMRVRLAFAVAAHLEPDILVVDEVLAVGDAEFQKKAVGKMQDISKGQGRTVLFVSHNMAAVKSLCTRGIVLEHGTVVFDGDTDEAVDYYLSNSDTESNVKLDERINRIGGDIFRFTDIQISSTFKDNLNELLSGEKYRIRIDYVCKENLPKVAFRLKFIDSNENVRFLCNNYFKKDFFQIKKTKGNFFFVDFQKFPLPIGNYSIQLTCFTENGIYDDIERAFNFDVIGGDFYGNGREQISREGVLVEYEINVN